jgi:hypothetical protein
MRRELRLSVCLVYWILCGKASLDKLTKMRQDASKSKTSDTASKKLEYGKAPSHQHSIAHLIVG